MILDSLRMRTKSDKRIIHTINLKVTDLYEALVFGILSAENLHKSSEKKSLSTCSFVPCIDLPT